MTRFGHDLADTERDAQNRVVARKAAVTAVVDALIRKIKRCKKAHRASEILQSKSPRSLRHRFKIDIRLRRNQLLESAHKRRFLERQIVQRIRERHPANYHA